MMKPIYESGDGIYVKNEQGELEKAIIINYIEDQQIYIVSGNPHRRLHESEIYTKNAADEYYMDRARERSNSKPR